MFSSNSFKFCIYFLGGSKFPILLAITLLVVIYPCFGSIYSLASGWHCFLITISGRLGRLDWVTRLCWDKWQGLKYVA